MQFQTNNVKIMFRTIKLRNIVLICINNKIIFNYGSRVGKYLVPTCNTLNTDNFSFLSIVISINI